MTPLDAMKQALEALEEANSSLSPNGRADRLVNNAIINLRTAIAEMESAEPVGRVIEKYNRNLETYYLDAELFADRGAVENEYLFTHPAQSRNDNEPTYGQLKIRLENASKTIEMQRCELFNLRDANRDSIIEECANRVEGWTAIILPAGKPRGGVW